MTDRLSIYQQWEYLFKCQACGKAEIFTEHELPNYQYREWEKCLECGEPMKVTRRKVALV